MSRSDNDYGFGVLGLLAIGGALAWIRREGKKNQAEFERKKAQENKRKNTKCKFEDGITESQFEEIVFSVTRNIKRLDTVSVSGPVVTCGVESQSGITTWCFQIDFNDHGHLTGRYWIYSDNKDSKIPNRIGEKISEQLKNIINAL